MWWNDYARSGRNGIKLRAARARARERERERDGRAASFTGGQSARMH